MQKKNGLKINPESINMDFFKNAFKVALKKREVQGFIIGMAGMMAAFGIASSISDKSDAINEESVAITNEIDEKDSIINFEHVGHDIPLVGLGADNPFSIDLSDVNSLNIIINDSSCRNNLFNEICEELQKDGVSFTTTQDCENVDVNNAVIITLDQLYMSSPGSVIFVPNDNERLGDSDALALAMEASFKENEFEIDAINAGKIGYEESRFGRFQSRIPTLTENAIGTDKNTSFVTVSFGTNSFDARSVADSIESGLARYIYYQREKTLGDDLIYRIQGGDLMGDLEERFDGSSKREILDYNELDNENRIPMDQTVRNPGIEHLTAFDEDIHIALDINRKNK